MPKNSLITKKTHYNPCFWTAFWNEEYYNKETEQGITDNPRDQTIYSLNLKANKILETNIDNVHFEKKLGQSTITPEAIKNYCKKAFPDEYESFAKKIDADPSTLVLDFENHFTGLEETPSYNSLIDVIRNNKISSIEEKANLSCFIFIHQLRNHTVMNSMMEIMDNMGHERFEHYICLRQLLSDVHIISSHSVPIFQAQWIVYKSSKHTLPLSDSPIMMKNRTIMVAISPRLLLEIDLNIKSDPEKWIEKDHISNSKLNEYRRRTISNSFKEIIFHDESVLLDWQNTKEFKKRVRLLKSTDSLSDIMIGKLNTDKFLSIFKAFQIN